MKNLIFFMLVGTFILPIVSCKKHASFHGKVTSSADNLPIEGAEVELAFIIGKKGGGAEVTASDVQKTDAMGDYMVEAEASRAGYGTLLPSKDGYAPAEAFSFIPSHSGEVNFVLNPYDAWIEVTFENTSSVREKQYYCNYTSAFLNNEIQAFNGIGPFKLQPNEVRTEIAKIPGGTDFFVKWDSTHVGNTPFRYKETIFCNRNDTTHLVIKI